MPGTFSRKDHRLDHKTSLGKFKKTEVISSIFSHHNGVRLEITYNGENCNNINMYSLNSVILSNQWVNKETKEKIRKYMATIVARWEGIVRLGEIGEEN